MIRYIVRRIGESLLTLVAVSMATFVILQLMPFNLAYIYAGPRASPGTAAAIAKALGLNLPVPVQYLLWLKQLAVSGGALAFQWAPPTLELLFFGSGLALVVALAVSYLQAQHPRSFFDRATSFVIYVLYTFPSFWVGFVLIYIFAIQLLWLPATGPSLDPQSQVFGQWVLYMILPVVTLALTTIATWSTYFRSAIEEALRSDYVRTARAKGLPEEQVALRHVLRNAALPMLTIAGMSLPSLFNNVIVIEMIFGMRGLGSMLVFSLTGFNYGIAVDLVFVIGTITVLGSLLVDIFYALADPRIQFS